MSLRQPQEFTYTIPANGQLDISVAGNKAAFLANTGTFSFSFDASGFTNGRSGVKYGLPPGEEFGTVRLQDTSGSANTITLLVAFGEITDSRLTVSGTLSTLEELPGNLSAFADKAVGAGATVLISGGSAIDRRLWVTNLDPTTTLRAGNAATAAAGLPIPPGQTLQFDNNGPIAVFNPGGHTVMVAAAVARMA